MRLSLLGCGEHHWPRNFYPGYSLSQERLLVITTRVKSENVLKAAHRTEEFESFPKVDHIKICEEVWIAP